MPYKTYRFIRRPRSVPRARQGLGVVDYGVVFREVDELPPQATRVRDRSPVRRFAARVSPIPS